MIFNKGKVLRIKLRPNQLFIGLNTTSHLVVLIFVLFFPFRIYSQSDFMKPKFSDAKVIDPEKELLQVESLYNQGQYQQVVTSIDNIFRTAKGLSDTALTRLYTYQAFAYVALDKKELAKNTFRYLLMVNPKMSFDPRYVSPKIIEVFEETRRQIGDTIKLIPKLYTYAQTDNRKVKIRSLIYPGLGQLSVKQNTKGYLFLCTETISLIGLVVSHFMTNSAHQEYLNNRNILEMDEKYNKYSFWYQCRLGFAVSCISIWFLNYLDASLY